MDGFDSPITLTCAAPAGLTCALSPSTISPGSGSSSTLTISAESTPPVTGYHASGIAAVMPGLGLFGTVITGRKRKLLNRKSIVRMSLLGLLLVISLFALGCGGSTGSNKSTTNARISTGHRDGDGHIRLTEPNRRCNSLHQLKQTKTQPGPRCALHGVLIKKGSSSQVADSGVHSSLRHYQKSRLDIYEVFIQAKLCGVAICNRTILKYAIADTLRTRARDPCVQERPVYIRKPIWEKFSRRIASLHLGGRAPSPNIYTTATSC